MLIPEQFGGWGLGVSAANANDRNVFGRAIGENQDVPISTHLILSHVATHVPGLPKSF